MENSIFEIVADTIAFIAAVIATSPVVYWIIKTFFKNN